MNYESDHPLYGRTDEQISIIAGLAASFDRIPRGGFVRMLPADLAAITHELMRLKSEAEESEGGDILNRAAISRKDRRIRELEMEATNHPPSDWLTRAIATAGAPEGTDWSGLLEHIDGLFKGADKLRGRAQDAEDKLSTLTRDGLPDYHGILNECSFSLGMKWGAKMSDAPEFARKLRERAESAEASIKQLESDLATANGYRTGISNDLRQVEEQSSGFSRELNAVASLLDGRPAGGVLIGPGIEDGVAFIVSKRLDLDAAKIKALEAQAIELAQERDLLSHSLIVERATTRPVDHTPRPVTGMESIAAGVDRMVIALERMANRD